MTVTAPVICIDGPSGAGKGVLSQCLAAELGWHLLDSGALYRGVGFAGRQAAVSLEDSDTVAAIARSLDVDFRPTDDGVSVWLAGKDVTAKLRTEEGGRVDSGGANARGEAPKRGRVMGIPKKRDAPVTADRTNRKERIRTISAKTFETIELDPHAQSWQFCKR